MLDIDDDDRGPTSPSWDRHAGNQSPLAALLRREFPVGGGQQYKPHSERRLFDDAY